MQNYDIYLKIANTVIDKIYTINYITNDSFNFVKSIPIFYSGKLYYQSVYTDNNNYKTYIPDFTNLTGVGGDVYNMIYNMYKPNKIMINTDIIKLKKRVIYMIKEIGRYNWFDMCINTRQIKSIIQTYTTTVTYNRDGDVFVPNNNNGLMEWLL